ncbi:hypothetical protein HELRODRAFT_167525 [Helobdella robusta]|uniref:RRM domain-containing protein n=1 Tax=Helobdella robusta TaxID=6412 RepID=T1EZG3_HELRO|nr:hypothetical protein HELRODRAFT_167525 [Helobdella robusta]ESO11006.1 hypothetical protein HELRODRAFT_167525 [Helobdella robusta]
MPKAKSAVETKTLTAQREEGRSKNWWSKRPPTSVKQRQSAADSDSTKKDDVPVFNTKKPASNKLTRKNSLIDNALPSKDKASLLKSEKPEKWVVEDADDDDNLEKKKLISKKKQKKNEKAYVLFVGNLPFDCGDEAIIKHFSDAGANVKAVRLLTNKISKQSRGCCYVEFHDSKSHMVGLRLHESTLGDRKINVEFTSRGRKTPNRMKKLKVKNERAQRFKKTFTQTSS